jgi:transposase
MRVWSRRFHDLARLRTQLLCRLHAVLCELVPGGFAKKLTLAHAEAILDRVVAESPIAQAKLDLARELTTDLQRIDAQRRDARRRTARAVAASGTTIIDIRGVGPILAGAVIGYVRDIHRFADRDHFASYNGTAPIEVSSGNRKVYRLSRRGNRQLNHAVHMAAVSQICYRGTEGRTYYEKKVAEGMNGKSALRALKRKISDALYTRMVNDARRQSAQGPGGQPGNDSASSAAGSHPATPALRTSHSRAATKPIPDAAECDSLLAPRPAPASRRTSRSATGVQVEPRPGPRRGARAGPTLTPASTGPHSQRNSRHPTRSPIDTKRSRYRAGPSQDERPAPVPQVCLIRGSSTLGRTEPLPEGAGRHDQCEARGHRLAGPGRAHGLDRSWGARGA